MVTAEIIRQKVGTDARWCERAIAAIYKYQTYSEQSTQTTNELNGVGFNGIDAFILSSFAEQINRGRTLSQKQLAIAFKKMPKYAGQLERIANANNQPAEKEQPEQPIDKEVTEFDITSNVTGSEETSWVAEASEIEHKFAGQLPRTLCIGGKKYKFEKQIRTNDNELVGDMYYHGNREIALMILND